MSLNELGFHVHTELTPMYYEALRASYEKDVTSIEDNIKKVQFALNTPVFKTLYKLANRFENLPKKCAIESSSYRDKGNRCYAEQKFIPALEYFNMSICFAPAHSEQLAKGYANRSAVYFSMKMFELSLKNIKMAREAGYPKSLASKLNEREAKCVSKLKKLKMKARNEFHGLKPKLSYASHKKVPFIANCLDLNVNEKYGRHIVTKTDLKVGDVIAIEQPFSPTISPKVSYLFCTNCFRENDLNLIPCPNCHSAMFCSPECLAAANKAFHAIECPIMNVLVQSNVLNHQAYTALRLLIVVLKDFKSAHELMVFKNDLENREQTVFNVDYEHTPNIDMFASVLKLFQYPMDHTVNQTALLTALLTKTVMNLKIFKEKFKTDEEINFLIQLIFNLYEIVLCHGSSALNCIEVESGIERTSNSENESLCIGVYPFSHLLNHSCAPNVQIIKHGIQNVIIVMKPIKNGEQLFKCYGNIHHNFVNRGARQTQIHSDHNFVCDCLACVKNYRTLTMRDKLEDHGVIKPVEHAKLCSDYKFDAVKELIPKYCEFLNLNFKKFPENHTNIAEDLLEDFLELAYIDEAPLALKEYLTQQIT